MPYRFEGTTYNASSPDELRAHAADVERSAQRRGDADLSRRADRARRAADQWDSERERYALQVAAHRRDARAGTQRRKDEFTAQYGSGVQRDRARKRLGYDG